MLRASPSNPENEKRTLTLSGPISQEDGRGPLWARRLGSQLSGPSGQVRWLQSLGQHPSPSPVKEPQATHVAFRPASVSSWQKLLGDRGIPGPKATREGSPGSQALLPCLTTDLEMGRGNAVDSSVTTALFHLVPQSQQLPKLPFAAPREHRAMHGPRAEAPNQRPGGGGPLPTWPTIPREEAAPVLGAHAAGPGTNRGWGEPRTEVGDESVLALHQLATSPRARPFLSGPQFPHLYHLHAHPEVPKSSSRETEGGDGLLAQRATWNTVVRKQFCSPLHPQGQAAWARHPAVPKAY